MESWRRLILFPNEIYIDDGIASLEGCKLAFPRFGKGDKKGNGEGEVEYLDLGSMYFEGEANSGNLIKLAEIYRYEDLNKIIQGAYDGNIILIDYSPIANDHDSLRRITSELKAVARDVNGDVAAIENNILILAPNGIKIDRSKIKGGFS